MTEEPSSVHFALTHDDVNEEIYRLEVKTERRYLCVMGTK
jgi:hypothetical protein